MPDSERPESSNAEPSELILLVNDGAVGALTDMESLSAPSVGPASDISGLLQAAGARTIPLFSAISSTPFELFGRTGDSDLQNSRHGMPNFFQVSVREDRKAALAADLRKADGVAAAYVKPPVAPAAMSEGFPTSSLNAMSARNEAAPSVTPDFSPSQGYLDAPPNGVNARWAWPQPGGGGDGVRVIDVEGAWRVTHEDLLENSLGLLAGSHHTSAKWRNHGTAVWGALGGDRGDKGVTGISPEAQLGAVSFAPNSIRGSATAIADAAEQLNPGDVLLIELHREGPASNQIEQHGFIAVEWWPDDLAAIQYAIALGVVVVEAGGNGSQDLDGAIYDMPDLGFPADWVNPFRRQPDDSGAIIVGAGAPPSGNYGPDRSRLDYSNYGLCVDAQGWGEEVVTCGYGDLQGGPDEDLWYTARFAGTSSASPIVAGAIVCVQGMLDAMGIARLSPWEARDALRVTGSPQQDHPQRPSSQQIGNRPDVEALYQYALSRS